MPQNTAVTKNGRKNGLISRILFSEMYKIMVNKVTFVGFRGAIAPIAHPLDPPIWHRLTYPFLQRENDEVS